MKIALVGPTHPHPGGISRHTTELAHRLHDAGHALDLVSWSAQYPAFLYPGTRQVPDGEPEVPPYPGVTRPLAWYRPDSWWRTGRALRDYDAVIVVHVSPVQVPAYLVMIAAVRAFTGQNRPRIVVLCHNALPHERRIGDVALTSALFGRADAVIVHSEDQARVARALTTAPVRVVDLPPLLPTGIPSGARQVEGQPQRRLLFFGTVRPYKGLDVLIQAMAKVPDVDLTIAGDPWVSLDPLKQLAAHVGVADRVSFRGEYVKSSELPQLFEAADALVLPYRTATASPNVSLAHAFGVPVVATRVGTFADQVHDDIDGVLAVPDSADDLARALTHLYEPGVLPKLRSGVREVDPDAGWNVYRAAVEAALDGISRGASLSPTPPPAPPRGQPSPSV